MDRLDDLKRRGRYRRRRVVSSRQGVEVEIDGNRLLSFCSNDYLGLANHPAVVEAFQRGLSRWGAGSGAAHLVTGHTRAHHQLEEELADYLGYPRALLFGSGYLANLGIHQALLGRGDRAIHDRLNHASLLDGARLSGARLLRYGHNDLSALERRLKERDGGATLVATDGVFSMDGDMAPLPEMVKACHRAAATLVVDDAHGFGVLGAQGRGTVAHFDLDSGSVPVVMATLGKSFGLSGAFVAGSEVVVESLVQAARSYIYTTASPPAQAEATRVALRLVREGDERRTHLRQLIEYFRREAQGLGLQLLPSQTPIQPLLFGVEEEALAWGERLQRRGLMVVPIRPPTVPEGTSRLRVTLSAAHTLDQVDRLLEALR